MTIPVCSFAFRSNRARSGCRCITDMKCRLTTIRKRPMKDEYHVTGTLYSLTKPLANPGKPGPEWNTMEITLDGPHTVVVWNGTKVTDFKEVASRSGSANLISSRNAVHDLSKVISACRTTPQRHRVLQRSCGQETSLINKLEKRRSSQMSKFSRRQFLEIGATCCRMPSFRRQDYFTETRFVLEASAGPVPPSDRLYFGMIGIGMQGLQLLAQSIDLPEVECVAACDLARRTPHPCARDDKQSESLCHSPLSRTSCQQGDRPCIVAAVPDHRHKQVVVDAVSAGKDIYCEKPMSHNKAADGVAMVEAATKTWQSNRANRLPACQFFNLRQG